jgi:hypothetical protein
VRPPPDLKESGSAEMVNCSAPKRAALLEIAAQGRRGSAEPPGKIVEDRAARAMSPTARCWSRSPAAWSVDRGDSYNAFHASRYSTSLVRVPAAAAIAASSERTRRVFQDAARWCPGPG